MNKYKLINKQTGLETLCDKVTIDGFDYYVSGNYKDGDYVILPLSNTFVKCVNGTTFIEGTQKVIATNNPNIDVPKVVDEIKKLAKEYTGEEMNRDDKRLFILLCSFGKKLKSQETHPFSEEDLKRAIEDFHEMNMAYLTGKDDDNLDINEFIKKWKAQRLKTLYYE